MLQSIPISFKVLIIGAPKVGKTTAIQRFIDNRFTPQIRPTIGVDFSLKSILLTSGTTISLPYSVVLQLWDIAGEKTFLTIMPYYIMGTQGLILACDSTNPLTLVQLDEYLAFVKQYLDPVHIPTILLSTKHDLPVNLKDVDIETFMHQHMINEYFPTSAVTGLNIDAAFHRISQLITEKISSEQV